MIPKMGILIRLVAVGAGSVATALAIEHLSELGIAGYVQIGVGLFLVVSGIITGPLK
jgi:hypothetical protein